MCGIAGILAPGAGRYHDALEKMIDALRHRGPDGTGIVEFDNCLLGHTRLSIVDIRDGQQPMRSAVSPTAVTFNGEIYDYRSIRSELKDYPFETQSDTEVLLALYEIHGGHMLTRVPGMFAFALWDERRQSLFCARDRFGEKPFYYAWGPEGEFVFASEIKSLLATGLIRPVLDRNAVAHYLQYLYVHPTQTIYKNVHTLPPAHCLRFGDGEAHVERYWKLPPCTTKIDPIEAEREFKRLFHQATQRQLVADVPVGAFLSGGLDSSTIVASASRHSADLTTCAFRFQDGPNELPYARSVAERYKTRHVELSDETANIPDLLLEMQHVYDEPFADSSNIPTYLICKFARGAVKAVLGGDGGDELLAGYSWWYGPLVRKQMETQRRSASAALVPAAADSYGLCCAVDPSEGVIAEAHRRQRRYFQNDELRLFGLPLPSIGDTYDVAHNTNTVDDALRMDIADYLPGDILVKTDRASMAHGLELRSPFLDVDFATFCISLPHSLKISEEQDKKILRRVFADDWPDSIRNRPKQGFGAPVPEWLRRPPVRALRRRFLDDREQRIFSLLPFDATRAAVDRGDYFTWILLVLAIWLEEHPCVIE